MFAFVQQINAQKQGGLEENWTVLLLSLPVALYYRAYSVFFRALLVTNELKSTWYKSISVVLKEEKKMSSGSFNSIETVQSTLRTGVTSFHS